MQFQQPSYPDGLGLRKRLGGDENLAFVYDYKAAHKLRVEDLKAALIAYGYVTTGKALVFLHIGQDDLRTLYYHLCVPDEGVAGGIRDVKESYAAVAQLASFYLLALQSEALQGSALSGFLEKANINYKAG
ncbi:hypothetical protein F4782DRAFT_108406 [Xylaria castorea]|nr:hypothetical protein F4782DRAFT_108406 [Xylaria castorea]